MIHPPQRSPRVKVGGLYHFGRMLDKIRAHQRGELPEEYHPNLGHPFGLDGSLCAFLNVTFADVCDRVKQGGSDEEILAWCHDHGAYHPNKAQKHIWNEFARKLGWDDVAGRFLKKVREEEGTTEVPGLITTFDYIDWREGRASPPSGD